MPVPVVVKGVLEPEDARAAADVGADGVVVSNHGGRQLDSVASSVSKLPDVVAAVGDRMEVLLDGGVRGGLDVLKAVALGARGKGARAEGGRVGEVGCVGWGRRWAPSH